MRLWLFVLIFSIIPSIGCGKTDAPQVSKEADGLSRSDDDNPRKADAVSPTTSPAVETPKRTAPKDEESQGAAADKTPAVDSAPDAAALPASGSAAAAKIPAPGTPFLLKRDGLLITSLILSKGFEKSLDGSRVPIEPGYAFPRDDRRVYVILDLENPGETESELKVGWIMPEDDKEGNAVTVTVKPRKTWRTFAFNSFVNKTPGLWQVVVRDSDDTILAHAAFEMNAE